MTGLVRPVILIEGQSHNASARFRAEHQAETAMRCAAKLKILADIWP